MIWIDIFDAAGARIGDGPVRIATSAAITRRLDGVGTISLSLPATDLRVRQLLQNERRVAVSVERDGVPREIGRGIVRNLRFSGSGSEQSLVASGPDELDELTRYSTLLARSYTGVTADTIAYALTALVPGWFLLPSGSVNLISARFDGASVFKALLELAQNQGLHIRAGLSPRVIELGAFGASSGLRVQAPPRAYTEVYYNADVAFIEKLTYLQDSEEVINWIAPVGLGEGVAALTLARSTRTSPYAIQSMAGADGRPIYFIADQASINDYGVIQKVMKFNVGPVSNSDADLTLAANALYDAAAATLAKRAVRLDTYRCTVRKLGRTVRPGDTVRLVWDDVVHNGGGEVISWRTLNQDMWVMQVVERFERDGLSVDLTLATVDRVATDAVELVVGAIESVQLDNLRVQTYQNTHRMQVVGQLDNTRPARFPIWFTNGTTALNRCLIRVTTRPFRSNVTGSAAGGGDTVTSAAGGDHDHMLTGIPASGGVSTGNWSYSFLTPSSLVTLVLPASVPGAGQQLKTFTASGNHTHTTTIDPHTHALIYGIYEDTVRPTNLRLWINGTDVTTELGGPWASDGAAVTFEVAITNYLSRAVGGLRREHTLEFRCDSGRGEVVVTIEQTETVQAIIGG